MFNESTRTIIRYSSKFNGILQLFSQAVFAFGAQYRNRFYFNQPTYFWQLKCFKNVYVVLHAVRRVSTAILNEMFYDQREKC